MFSTPDNEFECLRGKRLLLRGIKDDDLGYFIEYKGDHQAGSLHHRERLCLTKQGDVSQYYLKARNSQLDVPGQRYHFIIEKLDHKTRLGDCWIYTDKIDHRQVEVGISIKPLFRKQDYALEALTYLFEYLFWEREKNKIKAYTDSRDMVGQNLSTRMGMRQEAHFVDNILLGRNWYDEFLFAILRRDWLKNRNSPDFSSLDVASKERHIRR